MILRLDELLGLVTPLRRSARRDFIGGSDARLNVTPDEAALIRLGKEKRGDTESEDMSTNLLAQLGIATEGPDRDCYERKLKRRRFKRS